ncbi:MAG: acetyl-CoA carboxylase biotin carboxyl carrier protein subunit [Elusimicrobia bacterium]|nr:acetyl-CoA carboxylase biotin carboxyl carrier protein subunit [Elusimicrobiota bacterium]
MSNFKNPKKKSAFKELIPHPPSLITDIADWMRKTDLVEVAWKKGSKSMAVCLSGSTPSAHIPSTPSTPVCSPFVGIFHFNRPGEASSVKSGSPVKTGDILGWIDAGPLSHQILSPSSGKINRLFIEEGQPIQYGQPLFVIE